MPVQELDVLIPTQAAFQENQPSAAAFAVAGPVSQNKCVMTNLDWTIDGSELSKLYGIK